MITDLKPYPEYKASGLPWIGNLPSHWKVVRNSSLFSQRNQTGFGHLPILEVSLKTGIRIRDFENSTRKQIMSDLGKYKRAAKGDLAYNMMRMWQGAIGVAPVDGLVSPAYIVARPFPEVVTPYYSYLFRTDMYLGEVDACSRGIVKDRNRLYWDQFKQMTSLFPPPDEQAAIVRFLDYVNRRLERVIRAKRKVIALLNEQKQAIIHRAVTRGLDAGVSLKPSGIPWLGEIPVNWEVWRISRFARVGNGSTPSRSRPAYWQGGSYPWLNSSHVNRGFIDSADQFVTSTALEECHLPRVPMGSVLVAITGQGKTRGTAAVLGIEATINQHIAFIAPRFGVIVTEFLQMALTAAYQTLRALSEDSGSTKGALTCEDLKRFKLALPPRDEQAKLVGAIRVATQNLDTTIKRTEHEIALLCEYRTRLIADVVTGKLDARAATASLPDEADEPEALTEADTLDENGEMVDDTAEDDDV